MSEMSEDMEGHPRRLSISEETLRLQLAELELRLRIFFAEQLEKKANAIDVAANSARLDALERGDFTPAFTRAVHEQVVAEAFSSSGTVWTRRERMVMVIGLVVTIIMLSLNAYVVYQSTGFDAPASTKTAK